jgi:hypothetical protein
MSWKHANILTTTQEQCYDNLRISKNAWDTNLIKVSSTAHATPEYRRSYSLGQSRIHRSQLGS